MTLQDGMASMDAYKEIRDKVKGDLTEFIRETIKERLDWKWEYNHDETDGEPLATSAMHRDDFIVGIDHLGHVTTDMGNCFNLCHLSCEDLGVVAARIDGIAERREASKKKSFVDAMADQSARFAEIARQMADIAKAFAGFGEDD